MRSRTVQFGLLILLGFAGLRSLKADAVLVGTQDSDSIKPFGDDTVTAYQQLYSNIDFSSLAGPVSITELDFFVDPALIPIDPTDPTLLAYSPQYQVTLSEIDPSLGLSVSTNILNDLGASPAVNATATLNLGTDVLALTLATPFVYDPTQGNDLLLDVQQVIDPANPNFWTIFALQADDTLDSAGLDTSFCAFGCDYGLGLVTQFDETPVVSSSGTGGGTPTAPESSTSAFLASGLGLLAILIHRRAAARFGR